MDKQEISIDAKVTAEDYTTFSRIACKKTQSYNLSLIIIPGIVTYYALIESGKILDHLFPADEIQKYFPKLDMTIVKEFAPIFIIVMFYFVWLSLFKVFRKYSKNAFLSSSRAILQPKTVTITPEGVREERRLGMSFTPWKGITAIDDQKNLLLFYIDQYSAYVIPKNDFDAPEDAQKFLDQARTYWKDAREHAEQTQKDQKNPWAHASALPATTKPADNE